MKFSENTISVLKNFSSINPSVMFKSGNTVRTISPQKTVMATATIGETFSSNAGVYDLGRFLATLTLFDGFDVVLSASTDQTFEMVIKVENLKLMPADYEVSLSSKGLAHFKADKVQYFIAIEKHSKFGV